jgi:hypothetical protein
MSIIPLHLERRFERRWASRFNPPIVSNTPKIVGTKTRPLSGPSAAARGPITKEELADVRPNSRADREPQMNVLDHLIGVQAQIIRCRRLADENPDRAMALRFYQLADNLEQRVREVDRALCSPE